MTNETFIAACFAMMILLICFVGYRIETRIEKHCEPTVTRYVVDPLKPNS